MHDRRLLDVERSIRRVEVRPSAPCPLGVTLPEQLELEPGHIDGTFHVH